ncbi:MAG: MG2 domain-containing protein [Chloroflexi bacterium]|nr:MG2 domain-containing protein [Chloroflexota bacterium]
MRFNQAVVRGAVELAFFFRAGSESDAIDIAGGFEWMEDGKSFTFIPGARLWYDTEYVAGFPPLLPFSRGGKSWSYRTVPRPAIARTSPADGASGIRGGGFSLKFASRMNIDTLRERIHIEPEPERITNDYYSYMDERYDLYFKAQPSTEYTVRIDPGMEDRYGHPITDPLTFRFTTGPLPPTVDLRAPGSVGFYNAYRQPTNLFLTHRGVEEVNLEFYRLSVKALVADLNGGSSRTTSDYFDSRRALLRRWTIDGKVAENLTQYELLRLGAYGPISPDDDEPLRPGIYYLKATAPELEKWKRERTHYLNVSNAVLTLKHTFDRLTIWAVDVNSGAPIVGERVSVYNQLGEYEGGALSDERGIAQLPIWYEPEILFIGLTAVLDSAEYFGIGNTRWSEGMGRWDANRPYWDNDSDYLTYMRTDRPVYHPGQRIYFRGIVHSKDDVIYMPAPYETVEARLRSRETRKIVESRVLEVSEFGAFSGKFDIAPDASLGRYYISITFPNSRGEFRYETDRLMFMVAEYRLPEYQVTLSTDEPEILQGDKATFELEGRYFFGGPVSAAAAEYSAYPAPYQFNYEGDGRYRFTNGRPYRVRRGIHSEKRIVAEGSLQTDDDGVAKFDLVGDLGDEPGSQRWLVEASIRDEAGQTITANSDLVVHQGLLYIGAQPEKYVTRVGEDSVINIIAVDWDSQPIAEQDIEVQVVERRWARTQEQGLATGRVKSIWSVEEIPVPSGAVRTGADGKARFVFQPPEGGSFNINVSTEDKLGNPASATARIWAWGSSYIRWGRDSDKTIDLIPARKDYRVGDIAQVLIASPFQDATQALISIERGDVLSTEVVTLTSNSHIHEFEILPEHAPNVYVGVFLLNPAGEDRPFADWRMGTAQLQVDPERYALHIEISAEPERASPQEEVTFRLRVTDWKGEPVTAEVGVALTDLAALSLGERNSASLLETFFSPQARGVHTFSSLVHNGDEYTANLVETMGTLAMAPSIKARI